MIQLWEQLNITRAGPWTASQRKEIKQTFEEYNDVFALHPLELCRTALVKHTIRIMDPKPF